MSDVLLKSRFFLLRLNRGDQFECTCDGNFGGPVGGTFQHCQLGLFYGVYVGVGIHIKYHADTSNGNSGYMGQLQERRRTAITVETENR